MQTWAKSFYSSKAWLCCRDAYISNRISIDGGLCQVCGEQTGNIGEILHHQIMLTQSNISDPNVALNHDNLLWVCKDCHDDMPNHFNSVVGKVKSKCTFDANGIPIKK